MTASGRVWRSSRTGCSRSRRRRPDPRSENEEMSFRPEEISAVLQKELESYDTKIETKSVGVVLSVGDGIARVWGLDDALAGELVEFPGDVKGMVLNLEEDNVGAVLFGSDTLIKEGDP